MFGCCDESGISGKSRWWVIGALWLPDDKHLPKFEADLTALRQQSGCWGEFKWNKLAPAYKDPYAQFLNLTLALPDIHFTSMVIDTRLFGPDDMTKYHAEGGRQEAYTKFMRLLLKQRIADFTDLGHREFTLLYDRPSSVKREIAREFHEVLTRDMASLQRRVGEGCRFVHLSPVNSATVHLVQGTDILAGATRAAWEATHDGAVMSDLATEVQAQIESWAGAKLTATTFRRTARYRLWKWRPARR